MFPGKGGKRLTQSAISLLPISIIPGMIVSVIHNEGGSPMVWLGIVVVVVLIVVYMKKGGGCCSGKNPGEK